MVSLLMVITPEEAPLLMPVKLPDEVRLNCPRLSILFPLSNMLLFTELPVAIPVKEVAVAVEPGNTRILLAVLPPITL